MDKKDPKGNLITDKRLLEKLYLDTYVDRLKPNRIAPGLENLEKLKEYLFQLIKTVKQRKPKNGLEMILRKFLSQ